MAENNKNDYKYEMVAGNEETQAMFNTENSHVTIVPPVMSKTLPTKRQFLYIAACAANISAFVCGTSFGWTSPVIPQLSSNDTSINPLAEPVTENEKSWIGSLLPVGAVLGPFAAGIAADKIGRKNTLLIGTVPFIIAFIAAAYGSEVNTFFIVRFLFGLAVGGIFTVLPMYIGEISDDEVRGSLGSFMQLFITIGLLFSYCLGPYMNIKMFNLLCVAAPAFFLVVFYMFIPESPYYLILKDDRDAAEASLMKLRQQTKSEVQGEIVSIKATVDEALANKASFMDIFKSVGLKKALIISLSLVSLQQFSGINIVLFYTQDIFTAAGSTLAPEIATILVGLVQVISSALTPALVEKKGKRFLLMLSAVGMGASQGILGYFFYLKDGGRDVGSISWLPVTCLIAYIITYCLGFGPLPWAVMGELFPGNIKSTASTATAAVCWFLGFVITKYFGLLSEQIGNSGSFGVFSICCVGACLFVFKFVPETSGKSLQEIQDILSGNLK